VPQSGSRRDRDAMTKATAWIALVALVLMAAPILLALLF
jgi:hypothetical protein